MEIGEMPAGEFECSPDPGGSSTLLLDLNLADAPVLLGHDGIEEFGPFDGKQQERESVRRQARLVCATPSSLN